MHSQPRPSKTWRGLVRGVLLLVLSVGLAGGVGRVAAQERDGRASESATETARPRRFLSRCTVTFEPAVASYRNGSQEGQITITAPFACPWTVTSESAWLSLVGGGEGSGNGVARYAIAANPGRLRQGTLLVAGKPFRVTQCLCPPELGSDYVLPFPVGRSYLCSNSFDGRTGHDHAFRYSVDFNMPIGTRITAARAGTVEYVGDTFRDTDEGNDRANVVVVRHADGSFARYVHLTRGGALVKQGQSVAPGDPVGLSGSSGSPWIPHLHFDVTTGCSQPDCQTVPFCFRNTAAHPDGPVPGVIYTAVPY